MAPQPLSIEALAAEANVRPLYSVQHRSPMPESLRKITSVQRLWAHDRERDERWSDYLRRIEDNLFLGKLGAQTQSEFEQADGSELRDSSRKPAKMRALTSSSALAVNFFDAWRGVDLRALQRALGFSSDISDFRFEFKTRNYPVGPRSPNLDLLIRLKSGDAVGVESKFTEPYSSDDGHGVISARYFPPGTSLWTASELPSAQRLADRLKPDWIYLDVPQLLKHFLGLAQDPERPRTLFYLWYDTDGSDAVAHRAELERFETAIKDEHIVFRHRSYQSIFAELEPRDEPISGWYAYMSNRYFSSPAV